MSVPAIHPLSPNLAAFLEGGQAIVLASRDADCRPSVAIGLACRVSVDQCSLTVLLPRMQAWQLLADVAGSGQLAVVFSQPSTHRSVQIKGRHAVEAVPEPADYDLVTRQCESAMLALAAMGHDNDFLRVLFDFAAGDLTAIHCDVVDLFDQSPGPRAGQPLEVWR